MGIWKNKRPAEQSAAPFAALEVREDLTLPVLTEIRDLLKEQVEIGRDLQRKLVGYLGK